MSGKPVCRVITFGMSGLTPGRLSNREYEERLSGILIQETRHLLSEGVLPNTISHTLTPLDRSREQFLVTLLGIKPE